MAFAAHNYLLPPLHHTGPLKRSDLREPYAISLYGDDDPRKRGVPDSSLLNRHEWYEMLYFVNKFSHDFGQTKGDRLVALKAELLIRNYAPANLRSHQHIREWLLANWNNYA